MFALIRKFFYETIAQFRPEAAFGWATFWRKSSSPLLIPVAEPLAPVTEPPTTEPTQTRKKHDFSYHLLRKDLTDTALYVLERFERLRRANYETAPEEVPALEHLWGCDFLLLDLELAERLKGGDKWSVVSGVSNKELADTIWPFDFAFVRETGEDEDIAMELTRVRTVSAKDVRGILSRVVSKMVRIERGNFWDDGRWEAITTYAGLVNERWVRIKDYGDEIPIWYKQNMHESLIAFLPSILTARYEWHVAFGTIPNGPRILLPTNPAGCLRLFKNRNLPTGKTRRDALRHWVEEHWRDHQEGGLSFVCHHLRGHTQFKWNDLECELFVSAYDLEKEEFFKKQAKEWRAQRQHNRVRVHLKRKTP